MAKMTIKLNRSLNDCSFLWADEVDNIDLETVYREMQAQHANSPFAFRAERLKGCENNDVFGVESQEEEEIRDVDAKVVEEPKQLPEPE